MLKIIKYCPNHPDKKARNKSGLCRNCYEKYLINSNPEYKQRQRENSKKYREAHLEECKKRELETWKKKKDTPEYKFKRKVALLKKNYNLTYNQFLNLLTFQNNKCFICEQHLTENDKFTHIDHNHSTGEIRGILCSQCNWFMSKIDTVKNCLENLNNYVKNNGVQWKKL